MLSSKGKRGSIDKAGLRIIDPSALPLCCRCDDAQVMSVNSLWPAKALFPDGAALRVKVDEGSGPNSVGFWSRFEMWILGLVHGTTSAEVRGGSRKL